MNVLERRHLPPLLSEIHDPPKRLFGRGNGNPAILGGTAVAVVGARACSPYGRQVARMLGRELAGAGVVVVSGLALLTSDIETFWGSWIYWGKMALVVLLLINGLMMTRTEKTLTADTSGQSPGWDSLRRTAVTSLMLWFAIALAGVALANFS